MINEYYAKKYCKDDISLIENYNKAIADTTQTWVCHHRTEIWWNCTQKDLIDNECYYGRKACELIFLTPEEHKSLHHKGKIVSEEARKKISEAQKGRTSPRKGVTLLEETRIKISEAKKGKPSPNKGKTSSIFGQAFKEHYEITRADNKKLYSKEYYFYKRHERFSWEVK